MLLEQLCLVTLRISDFSVNGEARWGTVGWFMPLRLKGWHVSALLFPEQCPFLSVPRRCPVRTDSNAPFPGHLMAATKQSFHFVKNLIS